MKKREILAVSALGFSMGIICGFLISPVKGGFGNNTTNNYYVRRFVRIDN